MRLAPNLGKLILKTMMLSSILRASPGARAVDTKSLVAGNTAFALELYGQLKTNPGNLFFSPYSISTALAMTYAGARGDTEKQMARVLHFSENQRQLHSDFGQLQRQLGEAGKQKAIELNVANALWAQKGHPFLPAFLKITQDEYQANINQADFNTGADAARDEINRWVGQKTKDKIQDILGPGTLDQTTTLVLANAIYFKGRWAVPYKKEATSIEPFHVSSGSQVNVPLMHHFDEVRYMENGDFQAVELPYAGEGLSMMVLLPRQVDGCRKLEDGLNPALVSNTLSQMKKQRVEIFLPKFKLESSFRLNAALAAMGMPDAFGPKADFSGMDGTKLLYFSLVLHKAWGEVNEEGTEAAAATVVTMMMGMPPPRPPAPIFRADHPFIFFIRDMGSGSILFLGRLAGPSR
jgi:serpin B